MAIKLESLNCEQLTELIKRAEQRKMQVVAEHLESVREKVLGLLESNGLSLQDLFGSRRKSARSKPRKRHGSLAPASSRRKRSKSFGVSRRP